MQSNDFCRNVVFVKIPRSYPVISQCEMTLTSSGGGHETYRVNLTMRYTLREGAERPVDVRLAPTVAERIYGDKSKEPSFIPYCNMEELVGT